MKIARYPLDFDQRPLDLLGAVSVDATGNGGAQFPTQVLGPDGAPIDKVGLVLFDKNGNLVDMSLLTGAVAKVADRTALAAITAPVDGDARLLLEPGREGYFVFSSGVSIPLVTKDPYQGLYVAPANDASGASGVWIRKYNGPVYASWFGVTDGAANNAARVESIETIFYPRAAHIVLPVGEISFDRGVVFTRPHRIEGQGQGTEDTFAQPNGVGPTVLLFPHGTTGFRFKNGPGGLSAGSSGAQRASLSHLRIEFEGAMPADGTGNYAGGGATQITGVAPTGNFANGNAVLLEGAGPSLVIADRTFQITAGNNVATITNVVAGIGNPGVYVGQPIKLAGAGVAGADLIGFVGAWTSTQITIVNAAGAALNASTTVAAGAYTVTYPIVTEVEAGGGTAALTINHFPNLNQAVAGGALHRLSVGVYATCTIDMTNVEINSQGATGVSVAGGGIGLLLSGITSDISIADNCCFTNVKLGGNLSFAGVVLEGNDAQVNTFTSCNFAGPKVGVLDMGLLGNDFVGCHWAFNVGIVVAQQTAYTKIIGGYMETGTSYVASTIGKAFFFGTTAMNPGSGFVGAYADSGHWFMSPILADYAYFSKGLAAGGSKACYLGGNINNAPFTNGATPAGIYLGNADGTNGPNYLLSATNPSLGSFQELRVTASSVRFGSSFNGSQFGTLDANAFDHPTAFRIAGTKVVGAQGAAVADAAALTSADAPALTSVNATNAAAAPTQAEFNAFVAEFNKLRTDVGAMRTEFNKVRVDLGAARTQLNTALARLRAASGHGLIA